MLNTRIVPRTGYGICIGLGLLAGPSLSLAFCMQSNPSAQQQCLANEEREREQQEAREQRQREQEREQQEAREERQREQEQAREQAEERQQAERQQEIAQQQAQARQQAYEREQAAAQERARELQAEQERTRVQPSYQTPQPRVETPNYMSPTAVRQTSTQRPATEYSNTQTDSGAHEPKAAPLVSEPTRPRDMSVGAMTAPARVLPTLDTAVLATGVAGPRSSVVYTPHVVRQIQPEPKLAEPKLETPPPPVPAVVMRPAAVSGPAVAVVTHAAVVPPPMTTGFAVVPVSATNQPLYLAVTQMQSAQTGCAQADAYQNYVNSVASAQNTTDQGIAQMLQTIAANTSDPDLQNALMSAADQPNPINDALQQQLQSTASAYEGICQTRMAAAQANLAQALAAQQAPATPAFQTASTNLAAAAPSQQTAANAGTTVQVANTASQTSAAPANPSAANLAANTACPSVAATNMPSPQAPWGAWAVLGSTGLVFDISRVNDSTLTWRFLNAGSNTISSMQFNYTYVDAGTGQSTTMSDILPYPLSPGHSVGGWAAYTANTRGNVSLAVTQMSCSPGGMLQAQR